MELEHFYFEPLHTVDALFPAKISKEEAEKVAVAFLNKVSNGKAYEIDKNGIDYSYFSNQLITEPVSYEFVFVQKKDNVPIADELVQLSILGNGDVVGFYRYAEELKNATFDDKKQLQSKGELLQKIKDHIDVNLNYQVIYDVRTGDESIALVYSPTIKDGVHAISGQWQTEKGFTDKVPTEAKIEKLTASPLPARKENMTLEEAKKLAEQLLKIDSDQVKLSITSIEEMENGNGQVVYSIQFSYDWEYGGYGSSIEINKQTGEVISYHDMKRDVLRESGESSKNEGKLTEQQALAKAMDYLKEWVPSYLHNYAKPMEKASFEERQGIYHFAFPRVVNGIVVEGHQIYVGIGKDGSLFSLMVNYQENVKWPSVNDVISKEEAKNKLMDALSLKLQYMKNDSKENHYHLVYTPVYNNETYSYLDANSGEWNNLFSKKNMPVVSHATAEAELNYLVQNQILEIEDASTFNADTSITTGEALNILVKSLSYFHEFDFPVEETFSEPIATIDPDNPYYPIVDRAIKMEIIKSDESFNIEANLTREQLAVWYIRALGLETAAKNDDIYKLSFSDATEVQQEYKGYVALANALQLVSAENNQFNPNGEVTYTDVAVSIFKLAHTIYE